MKKFSFYLSTVLGCIFFGLHFFDSIKLNRLVDQLRTANLLNNEKFVSNISSLRLEDHIYFILASLFLAISFQVTDFSFKGKEVTKIKNDTLKFIKEFAQKNTIAFEYLLIAQAIFIAIRIIVLSNFLFPVFFIIGCTFFILSYILIDCPNTKHKNVIIKSVRVVFILLISIFLIQG